jgi:hypothetical protein
MSNSITLLKDDGTNVYWSYCINDCNCAI